MTTRDVSRDLTPLEEAVYACLYKESYHGMAHIAETVRASVPDVRRALHSLRAKQLVLYTWSWNPDTERVHGSGYFLA